MAQVTATDAHLTLPAARPVPSQALVSFLLITLAITWGIAGFYIFLPDTAVALFGGLEGAHPLYFVATWGPGIAGILVVLIHGGARGLRAFLSRLFLCPRAANPSPVLPPSRPWADLATSGLPGNPTGLRPRPIGRRRSPARTSPPRPSQAPSRGPHASR